MLALRLRLGFSTTSVLSVLAVVSGLLSSVVVGSAPSALTDSFALELAGCLRRFGAVSFSVLTDSFGASSFTAPVLSVFGVLTVFSSIS